MIVSAEIPSRGWEVGVLRVVERVHSVVGDLHNNGGGRCSKKKSVPKSSSDNFSEEEEGSVVEVLVVRVSCLMLEAEGLGYGYTNLEEIDLGGDRTIMTGRSNNRRA